MARLEPGERPVLQKSLSASASQVLSVVEAYSLSLSSLVLVGGSLGDRFGRRCVFALGILLFGVCSAACGLAPSVQVLIFARAVQGVGAALLVPSSLAILGAAFPPAARGRAVGTWSALTSACTALGPVLGGWLVQVLSWRAVFFLNLPIAAASLVIAFASVPQSRGAAGGKLSSHLSAAARHIPAEERRKQARRGRAAARSCARGDAAGPPHDRRVPARLVPHLHDRRGRAGGSRERDGGSGDAREREVTCLLSVFRGLGGRPATLQSESRDLAIS